MKKSTIFLLVLVYIASFLIVGLFGISVKSYDSIQYIESILIEIPTTQVENVTPTIGKEVKDDNIDRHMIYTIRFNYIEKDLDGKINTVVRLKASPYPSNSTTTGLRLQVPEESSVASVTQEDNFYFNVSFFEEEAYSFDIYATDGYGAYTTVKLMYNFKI